MANTTENTDRIEQRREKRNKKKKRAWIPKALLVLVAVYFILMIAMSFHKTIVTYTAQTGTIEELIQTEGYIFRSQEVINSPSGGFFQAEAEEGQRVSEGTVVAYVYQSNVDPAVTAQIKDIRTQIESIEKNETDNDVYANTATRVEQRIATVAAGLGTERIKNDMSAIAYKKAEINKLIDKKRAITGERPSNEEMLAALNEELATLEMGIDSEKTPLTAPAGGVFSSRIDGMEDSLSMDKLDGVSPAYIEELDKKKVNYSASVQEGQPVCKVVDNYTWCYVANVDEKAARELNIGQSVRLRFYDITDSAVYGLIKSISGAEKGKVTLTISTNRYVESIYSTSRTAAEVLTASYEGIKVPAESLRVLDGQTGVYVIRLDVAHFVPVDLKFKNDDWAIISSMDSETYDYKLQIYDEVVVDSKNMSDGKVVR